MTKPSPFVASSQCKPERDAAVIVPDKLYSEDGREFWIKSWEPRVAQGECVTVVIHAFVAVPGKESQ
jgi:hypothetical protein